jgi:uncharacterized membrane protein
LSPSREAILLIRPLFHYRNDLMVLIIEMTSWFSSEMSYCTISIGFWFIDIRFTFPATYIIFYLSVFVLSNLVHINFRNDHVKFFCTQVIEDFLKTRYEQTSISDQQTVKSFIARCLQLQVVIDLINNSVIDINSKKEAYFLIQII